MSEGFNRSIFFSVGINMEAWATGVAPTGGLHDGLTFDENVLFGVDLAFSFRSL